MTWRNWRSQVIAALLLAVMALQLVLMTRATSATWDEPHHLFDGYAIWTRHDYSLNAEVPPLLKLIAALPLLHARLFVPRDQGRTVPKEAFLDGREFVFSNGGDRVLFPARMACMLFTLALGWLLFAATREMFGEIFGGWAALLALTLFVFDPNFLAHGALVTTDAGIACLLFATIYAWYRYIAAPSWQRLLLTAIAAGLTLAVKFTGILVLPMLLLLVLGEAARQRSLRGLGRRILALAAVTIVGVVVLWSFYGFRYRAHPDGSELKPSLAEYIQTVPSASDARHLALLSRWHLLPEAYIWGLANTKLTEDADTSYFFGHVYRHGNWKYFPAAFLIKSTLPLLLVTFGIVPVALLFGYRRRGREVLFLSVPVVVYLAVAIHSDMNIGMRHILPIYPFLYALGAGAAGVLSQRSRRWVYLFGLLVLWQVVTALRVAPATYMAYANEAWGGPAQVHRYLSDANSDWGQQLKEASRYLKARGITDCWIVYFPDGAIEPADYGVPCRRLPTTSNLWWLKLPMEVPPVIEGTVLISDSDLEGIEFGQGKLNPYESFRGVRPTTLIQGGLFVYDGSFAVPLVSALVQAQHAQDHLADGHVEEALVLAKEAVRLAPESVNAQEAMGDVLVKLGDNAAAVGHYQSAIEAAQTIEPELQQDLLPGLKAKLATALKNR